MECSKSTTILKSQIIDPNGDVVLVLEATELQVSSKVLSLASQVFKAMFGPYFAEGHAISSNRPCRINLAEDDPNSMTTLCNILHHRTQSVPRKPGLLFIERLVVLIDKYNCSDSLKAWTQLWLMVLQTEAEDPSAVGRLLYPAFICDDAHAFQKITKAMVMDVGSKTTSPPRAQYQIDSEIQALLPDGLLSKLMRFTRVLELANYRAITAQLQVAEQEVKSRLRLDLERIISTMMSRPPYESTFVERVNCNAYKKYMSSCDCKNILMYLEWLQDLKLWPLETAFGASTITTLCETLSEYDDDLTNSHLWACDACRLNVGAAITSATKTALGSFHGLCLDCVKHGGPERKVGPPCRIAHDRKKSRCP